MWVASLSAFSEAWAFCSTAARNWFPFLLWKSFLGIISSTAFSLAAADAGYGPSSSTANSATAGPGCSIVSTCSRPAGEVLKILTVPEWTTNNPGQGVPSTLRNPIRMMEMEHGRAGNALECIRRASSNYTAPADRGSSYQLLYQALQAFETDLHQHIHLENNILFPRAIEMESEGIHLA